MIDSRTKLHISELVLKFEKLSVVSWRAGIWVSEHLFLTEKNLILYIYDTLFRLVIKLKQQLKLIENFRFFFLLKILNTSTGVT